MDRTPYLAVMLDAAAREDHEALSAVADLAGSFHGQPAPGDGLVDGGPDAEARQQAALWAFVRARMSRQSVAEGCVPNKTGKGHHDDETGHPCRPANASGSGSGRAAASKELWAMSQEEAENLAPDRVEPDPERLEDIGDALRVAMEEAVGDPKDQCIATAYALKAIYPEAKIYEGTISGEPHTLAFLAGRFIDVTADQFGGWDRVQVLDPGDLPREYRHFELSHDQGEDAATRERWHTQKAVTNAFRETIRAESRRRAASDHHDIVNAAIAAGRPVPKEALAAYPYLQKKYAAMRGRQE